MSDEHLSLEERDLKTEKLLALRSDLSEEEKEATRKYIHDNGLTDCGGEIEGTIEEAVEHFRIWKELQ